MAEQNQAFSQRLSEALNRAGTSQVQLAEAIGIEKTTLNRYIKRGRVPEWDILVKLSDRLNVSCDWLLKGEQSEACPKEAMMAGQDYIGLPKGDDKELSEPERATLEQALEVLRATGEPGGGYAKALYQNIQMFHRGLRDAKAAAQNPSSGAGAVGSSRGGRKRRSGAGS